MPVGGSSETLGFPVKSEEEKMSWREGLASRLIYVQSCIYSLNTISKYFYFQW